jgi:hypothetical protein
MPCLKLMSNSVKSWMGWMCLNAIMGRLILSQETVFESVVLIPYLVEDLEGRLWHRSISVGTPPAEFTGLSHINQALLYKFSYWTSLVPYSVEFDTAISDLSLPGIGCTEYCENRTIYNPRHSSTSKYLRNPFNILWGKYGGNVFLAKQYDDTVTIAGLTALDQTFGKANTYLSAYTVYSELPVGGIQVGGSGRSLHIMPIQWFRL